MSQGGRGAATAGAATVSLPSRRRGSSTGRTARWRRRRSPATGDPAQLVELGRGQVAHDREVARRRLEVLAERQEVAADRPEVGQGLEDLLGRLAQAEHQAALGPGLGARPLGVLEDREADAVLALAADVLLEPGDRLEVVVEDLGPGREDDVDRVGCGRRSRGSGPRSVAPVRLADRQDAAPEVLGTAVGEVVAGDRGDHDVPQPEPVAGLGQAVAARRRPRPRACRA